MPLYVDTVCDAGNGTLLALNASSWIAVLVTVTPPGSVLLPWPAAYAFASA
jgi:hypothetical protein